MSHTEQHLPPHCGSEISPAAAGGPPGVLQENAALEPGPVQDQWASSVCGQPGPGDLNRAVTHTRTHIHCVLLEVLQLYCCSFSSVVSAGERTLSQQKVIFIIIFTLTVKVSAAVSSKFRCSSRHTVSLCLVSDNITDDIVSTNQQWPILHFAFLMNVFVVFSQKKKKKSDP